MTKAPQDPVDLHRVLTVDVVDVVNAHLLVIDLLPPERQLVSNAVGKSQRFGDPDTMQSQRTDVRRVTSAVYHNIINNISLDASRRLALALTGRQGNKQSKRLF